MHPPMPATHPSAWQPVLSRPSLPSPAPSPSRRSVDAGCGGTARVLLGLGVSPGSKACRAMMDRFAQVGSGGFV